MAENEKGYPNNSYNRIQPRSQEQKKNEKKPDLTPVAKGKEKKKSFGEVLTDNFLSTSWSEIKRSLVYEWIIPGTKDIIEHVVHMLLFKDGSDPRITRSRGDSRLSSPSYNKIYNRRERDRERDRDRDEYITNKVSRNPEITFATRREAEDVLTRLFDILSEYNRVTVKDFYTLADMPTEFAMANWGWRDLTGSSVKEVRGGYLLKLPRTEEMR